MMETCSCLLLQVLLCITYSPNFDINGDSILRIAEVGRPEAARGSISTGNVSKM